MFSTYQKVSCPPAIMCSFSQICFLLIPTMVTTNGILFPLGRKSICTSQVKDKYVSTIRESCFHFKKSLKKIEKIRVH